MLIINGIIPIYYAILSFVKKKGFPINMNLFLITHVGMRVVLSILYELVSWYKSTPLRYSS